MCLGIPGRVTEIFDDRDLLCGRVDFAGAVKEVCLAYVPDVQVGEYVIVHVGFAISRLDEEEALRTLRMLRQLGDLVDQELATDVTVDRHLANDVTSDGPR
jgi:hydrogenase expression/formation protein HypC